MFKPFNYRNTKDLEINLMKNNNIIISFKNIISSCHNNREKIKKFLEIQITNKNYTSRATHMITRMRGEIIRQTPNVT